MTDTWTIEDAKNDFAAIAEAAYAGRPQYIANGSRPDLVVRAAQKADEQENQKLEENRRFVKFLLSIPQGEPFLDETDTREIQPRDVEF